MHGGTTDRGSHVYPAFARKNAPASNLAEVIPSQWKTTGRTHLSLVVPAAEDINGFPYSRAAIQRL